ncbi:hypothetical protein BKA80DRAFT_218564 [Phyllosticta citrichinensis]
MISTMSSLSTPQDRPLSHILHTPNDDSLGSGRPTDQDMFATAALERHRSFIEREIAAATDQERLELFADFIVNESRLRRDRYSGAFDAMASDILDLTRDMWRSYKTPSTGRRSTTPNMSLDRPTERKDSVSSSVSESHMAMSTVPDEENSRGRSASRWWEGSADDSNGNDRIKLERSKRESKYMGLEDAKHIKENYTTTGGSLRERGLQGERSRRAELREEISAKVRAGEITFAEAAKAEAEFEVTEAQITQRRVQQEFDMFQKDVMTPLHALLSERVRKATACIEHVRSGLCNDAQMASPNQSLEEGDNQPEILEKLTLLKWLFEARENLHKELFELEGERNELYKTVVLTPYKAANNTEKMREAEAFFNGDSSERKLSYEKEALLRSEDLLSTIEQNVTRGVEDQLSAFWDIAPGLLAVVQKVPGRLSDAFQIAIPAQEMAENPQYADFPLQYLFSVLVHARRSAHQFIESQINLLCLLHEVKTAAMTANTRLLCTQRTQEGEDGATVEGEVAAIRGDEEERLTLDLKEKVSTVEGQWSEALGKGLEGCMDRVKEFLDDRGGWDESLQE